MWKKENIQNDYKAVSAFSCLARAKHGGNRNISLAGVSSKRKYEA